MTMAAVNLQLVAMSCTAGTCPAIYRTERDTVVVQGYVVAAGDIGLSVTGQEALVEIPISLLAAAARSLAQAA